jgi:SpoVK/Ycf46/Vps4 family AAA+-type ATPase
LPDEETRGQIFKIHIRKRHRDPKIFDIKKLATVSQGYSGAEIEQAVISALHQAYDEKSELDTEKIIHAVKVSPPLSVTMAEKVQQLRQWAKNRCVPAD